MSFLLCRSNVKFSTQPGGKQRGAQDKQDTGTGQKAAYGLRKVGDETLTTSITMSLTSSESL